MLDLDELGARAKARRKERGLTQSQVAAGARVSRVQVDRFENRRVSEMGYRSLMRILNTLGLDLRLGELNANRPTLEDLRGEADT
jgi:transcriptional regulator with XRE-family HTH domain